MNYPLVGAFVLMLGAALLGVAFWLASGGALAKHYDRYLAIEEESVAGLNLNAPVKFNGVTVGKVSDIELDLQDPQRVHLTFAIQQGTPIKEDTLAVLKVQGLTGIAYVELSGGAAGAAPLLAVPPERYPVIRTTPSLSARLENVLATALVRLDHLSTTLDAVLSPANQAAFSSTLGDMAVIAHTIAARRQTLDDGITHAAQTFDNTARGTRNLAATIDQIGKSAAAIEQMGHSAAQASDKASQTLATADTDLQQFNTETLPELQRLLLQLDDLSTSLRHLSDQTERNPSGLLLGRSPVPDGPGETPGTRTRP